jgi:hypothetical protein
VWKVAFLFIFEALSQRLTLGTKVSKPRFESWISIIRSLLDLNIRYEPHRLCMYEYGNRVPSLREQTFTFAFIALAPCPTEGSLAARGWSGVLTAVPAASNPQSITGAPLSLASQVQGQRTASQSLHSLWHATRLSALPHSTCTGASFILQLCNDAVSDAVVNIAAWRE